MGPLLTSDVSDLLLAARRAGAAQVECSLDLRRSTAVADVGADSWGWRGRRYPYLERCKERTIYHWLDDGFQPVARYSSSLVKLIPTEWGAPTFEIDGIKMLPTAKVSPYADAERKVTLIQPAGKVILDTCGGLGYFAAWCVQLRAARILSYEKNPDVLWLRTLNPWSPAVGEPLSLTELDVSSGIALLPAGSVDAALHDPPRFGIAGELYSQGFYDQLARVLRRKGKLFHYTGTPNKLTTGRDVPQEVSIRLRNAGFAVERNGDGLLAVKK